MTAGWLAFDEQTRARLKEIAARPVDIFGDAINLANEDRIRLKLFARQRGGPPQPAVDERTAEVDARIIQSLRAGPLRAAQIAKRTGMMSDDLAIAIASLINRGTIVRDAEGFVELNRR